MRRIFVDTSAWVVIADAGDADHEIALLFKEEIEVNCRLVVTNYILDELFTLMLMNQGYQETVNLKNQLDIMIQSGILEVIWVTLEIANEAWEVFLKYNVDKKWSFTDCVSQVIMKKNEISEVFTFDHHFEQMGFEKKP